MARLIYNTDRGRLQRSFGDYSPVSMGEVLRPIRGSAVPIELFLVGDHGDYTTPTATDYELTIGRPAKVVESGVLQITWTGTSDDIPLDQARISARIESALNRVSEIDAAGGVDVAEVVPGRIFSITWRDDGARALATAEITATHQPSGAYIKRVSAGTASSREVQILSLEESTLAEVTTAGWSANASPALAVSVVVTGTASIREVESLTVTGDAAPGASFGIGDSIQIPVDARADHIKALLNEELGAGTIREVKSIGDKKWLVYWQAVGAQTTLAEGSSNLTRQPGLTASLDLDTTRLTAAMRSGDSMRALCTLKNVTTGEILIAEPVTIRDPGAEITYATSGIYDTDGNIITDTDGNPI